MKVNTWKTEDKTYTYDYLYYIDADENILVLSSTTIDLNDLTTSFYLDFRFSKIKDEINTDFKQNNKYHFWRYYSYNNNVQQIAKQLSRNDYAHYMAFTQHFTLFDLLSDNFDITNYISNGSESVNLSWNQDYLHINKSQIPYTANNVDYDITEYFSFKYNDSLILDCDSHYIYYITSTGDVTKIDADKSVMYNQTLYISDDRIIGCYDYTIEAVDVVNLNKIYQINLTDINSDLSNRYNNQHFMYYLLSRTDSDIELLVGVLLNETNPEDNNTYGVLHLYKVTGTNYKTDDASYSVDEYEIDYGLINKYLSFNTGDYNIISFNYKVNAFNNEYIFYIIGNMIITLKWDEDNSKYLVINYQEFNDNILPVWHKPLELIEHNYRSDTNGDQRITFLTFNGTSWEVNQSVASKSPIMIKDNTLYYIGGDDRLVIDKYTTKPSASITFDDNDYVYVNGQVIHTGITINSMYYLPETTTRYKVIINTNNAEFATNHQRYFEIEMQNGNYPLKLDITHNGLIDIQLDLIGMWILTNGIVRTFDRKSQITFEHSIERIWS